MRAAALPILFASALASASTPLAPPGEPLDSALKRARAEAANADAMARRLEGAAQVARGAAAKLRAQQLASAQAIAAAEARISAADAELRLVRTQVALRRFRLDREQRPAASLLAGLAMMAERPPLLAIADGRSTDQLIEVRLLLEATLPVIRRRTAALAAQVREGERLALAAGAARQALVRGRAELGRRKAEFAALEQTALRLAAEQGSEALGAGDVALAASEQAGELEAASTDAAAARRIAAQLVVLGPAPPRPGPAPGAAEPPPLAYRLPSGAPVTIGLGAVSSAGVRSRGVTLATGRGAALIVPAPGVIRFAGPFRSYDGIVIIDHGSGWTTLVLNVASSLRPGTRVGAGEPLGRALGPVTVELSGNGRHLSPALVAGSSGVLSKAGKGG